MARAEITSTARIEAFSDAVIAIVITIMVLEFRLPYALSFVILTNLWISHHALLHSVQRATPVLMWMNCNLLFWMSLVPFATMVFGESPLTHSAVALYGSSLAMTSLSFTSLRWVVIKQNKFQGDALRAQRDGFRRSLIANAIYVVSVPVALFSVYVAFALFIVSPIMFGVWYMRLSKRV